MKEIAVSALVLIVLSGCVAPPTGNEPSSEIMMTAGPQPSREVAERAVMKHLRDALKDPDSLKQFEIDSGPTLITWTRGLINGGGNDQGWLMCFRYNAKNSYGAYIGVKPDGIVLRESSGDYYMVERVNWQLASARC